MAIGTTVSGIFRNGVIELSELPTGIAPGARVQVTFLEDAPTDPAQREALRQEAFADMDRGIDLGGPPYLTRPDAIDSKREAADRLIGAMEEGIPFGEAPYPSRDELHERRD